MKAVKIVDVRDQHSATAFSEIVIWRVPKPVAGSAHNHKYRLAYVVNEVCVVRLDNETGKGDHVHFGATQSAYSFVSNDRLLDDFNGYIERWNHENGGT
jgi:hypothetical protein